MIEDLAAQPRLKVDRELIRQTFGRVVAPRVRDRLLADPGSLRLDGVRQSVTVLFADIHEFTSFSEQTPPDIMFEVLNSYLSLAARVILEEEGTLDKFMGDAVMAIWNAPIPQADHALRAVRAAVTIDQAIKVHRSLLDYTYRLYFSIGISTGDAMLGNVGTRQLFNYTAVGDTVNLARQLESIARPGQILLSRTTYEDVAGRVIARELPPQEIGGFRSAISAYELLSDVF